MRSRLARVARASFATLATIIVSTLTFTEGLSAAPPASSLWRLDPAFGSAGQRVTTLTSLAANDPGRVDVEMLDDGRTALSSPNGFEMLRPDASRDTAYESNSSSSLRPPYPPYGVVDDIEFQAGKLLALNADYLVRLNSNGTLDTTFGNGGSIYIPFGGLTNAATTLALDPLDRIVVVLSVPTSPTDTSLAFVRFGINGQLDGSFGNQGRVTMSVSSLADEYNRPVPLPTGRFLRGFYPDGSIIYSSANLAVLRRLSANGEVIAGSTFIEEKSFTPHSQLAFDVIGLADGSMIAGRTYTVTAQPGGPTIAGPFTELQRIQPSSIGPNATVTLLPTLGSFALTSLVKNGRWITAGGVDAGTGTAKFVRTDIYGEIDREFGLASNTSSSRGCESFATNLRIVMCASKNSGSLMVNRLVGDAPVSDYEAIPAVRLRDTRAGYSNDVGEVGVSALGAKTTTFVPILGRGLIPANADSVAVNATVTNPLSAGYLTLFSCDKPRPTTSNVNFVAGQTVSNVVIAEPDRWGNVCIYSSATTDIVIDAIGFNRATSDYSANLRRVFDTRPGFPTVDGRFAGKRLDGTPGPIPPDESVAGFELPGAGAGQTVLFNVTVVNPQAAGWVRVFPCLGVEPATSNVNFAAGQTAANMVLVSFPASTNPRIQPPPSTFCIRSSASTDLVVDVIGQYDAHSSVHTITAARLRETRATEKTFDSQEVGPGPLAARTTDEVAITNRAGIPTDARIAALTVTVSNPTSTGWIAVYPCGTPRPNTSNINFAAGQTTANTVLASIGSNGKVCVYTSAKTDVIVDAYAWMS
jgi:hypothetical protein